MPLLYPPDVIRVIAIDPGSYKCGFSVFNIDFKTRKLLSIVSETIMVEKLRNDTGLFEDYISPAMLRYYKLRNELIRRFEEIQPHYVAYEGPFMNKLQPSAYGPLVSLMTLAHDAVIMYNLSTMFRTYQPQVVKKAISISGKKGKEVVIEALLKVKEVMDVLQTDIRTLDDNGVDSIVVGYTFFREDIQKSDDYIKPSKKEKR